MEYCGHAGGFDQSAPTLGDSWAVPVPCLVSIGLCKCVLWIAANVLWWTEEARAEECRAVHSSSRPVHHCVRIWVCVYVCVCGERVFLLCVCLCMYIHYSLGYTRAVRATCWLVHKLRVFVCAVLLFVWCGTLWPVLCCVGFLWPGLPLLPCCGCRYVPLSVRRHCCRVLGLIDPTPCVALTTQSSFVSRSRNGHGCC